MLRCEYEGKKICKQELSFRKRIRECYSVATPIFCVITINQQIGNQIPIDILETNFINVIFTNNIIPIFLIKLTTLHRKEYENICTNMFVRYQQCKIFYKTPFCREHYDISETPSSKKGQIHLPFKV